MKFNRKNKILVIVILFALISINYLPMMWNRLTGNGATFVEFYHYPIPCKVFIKKVIDLQKSDSSKVNIDEEFSGYLHLEFFDKENSKYFHTYITTDSSSKETTIVFYGVSLDKHKESVERINTNFGLIGRAYYINRFKKIVLEKIG